MSYTYQYPRPAFAVDCVVFGLDEEHLKVLLIERDREPFAGCWALPGGFVEIDEAIDDAARRELAEETGVENVFLEQLYTFGAVDRDPRDRVVSVAYYALVNLLDHQLHAASDARQAAWFSVKRLPRLAFDHREILNLAQQRLRGVVRYRPIGFELLPRKFTLRQLQHLYETILDRKLDKRNFRKKILGMQLLQELGECESGVAHRAARLYRFDRRNYNQLVNKGFNFEL